jgi:hypothetical protein
VPAATRTHNQQDDSNDRRGSALRLESVRPLTYKPVPSCAVHENASNEPQRCRSVRPLFVNKHADLRNSARRGSAGADGSHDTPRAISP